MKMKLTSENANQTMLIAEKIAKSLSAPVVVSLVGDLGAGKTTFAKGFANGLEIAEDVTSPTFTILNEYTSGKTKLYHFDMYRLSSKEEAVEAGFEEYFDLKTLKGIVLVEWAENVEGLLPMKHLEIAIEKVDDSKRNLYFEMKGNI